MPATSTTKRFIRGLGRSSSNKAFRRWRSRPLVGEEEVGSSLSGPIAAGSIVAVGASGVAATASLRPILPASGGQSRATLPSAVAALRPGRSELHSSLKTIMTRTEASSAGIWVGGTPCRE
jgi:hypothetical protein